MAGSALSPVLCFGEAQPLIKQGKKITFPASSAIGTLIIFGKIAKAIFGPFGAFIMENGQGCMIHIQEHRSTFFRFDAGGGGGSPRASGRQAAKPGWDTQASYGGWCKAPATATAEATGEGGTCSGGGHRGEHDTSTFC